MNERYPFDNLDEIEMIREWNLRRTAEIKPQPLRQAEQAAKSLIYEFLDSHTIPTPWARLARGYDELFAEGRISFQGREQEELFTTQPVFTGSIDHGIIYVSPKINQEIVEREASVRADLLLSVGRAAFIDGHNEHVGDVRSMQEVRAIVQSYLITVPTDQLTDDQQRLLYDLDQ